MLCSTYKGLLPSDLFDKYDCEGGLHRLELDVVVAGEIADQLNESQQDSKKKTKKANKGRAKGAVARRDQRRQLYSGAETAKALNDMIDKQGR
jgi:hypothetical protein